MTELAAQHQVEPPAKGSKKPKAALNGARSFWLKQLHSWHWISAAVSLVGLLLFAFTGITLNHAASIPADPVTVEQTAALPAPLVERLADFPEETTDPVPDAVARWSAQTLKAEIAGKPTETTAEEIYVALPTPGGDGWVTIDRSTGDVLHEKTTRGWIAYLNDLHKGRNAGGVWFWFIDVFAVACVIFALTGLGLMWLHAKGRPSTWPLAALGLLIPVVIALIFIH
ncbi:membrane protein [Brevundimonas intermedia]|uniref:Membrane protein n=1 Tax=Brevundimonas intermedia TaxID=74315 RepID=A0ABQ5T7M0_9CAUL|nr:PepSY-associated TM helix domain-containing protein [Brevundimonas intermedia]GLK48361.1 membrane protein [Brevundimonas intermedia]